MDRVEILQFLELIIEERKKECTFPLSSSVHKGKTELLTGEQRMIKHVFTSRLRNIWLFSFLLRHEIKESEGKSLSLSKIERSSMLIRIVNEFMSTHNL